MVFLEMMTTIMANYHSMPDPRTLRVSEILTFYNCLRATLRKLSSKKN